MKGIFKVVQQGEAFAVQSQKADGGQTMKCMMVMQSLGGKFEDQFVVTMWGNTASLRFFPGDTVAAALHFSTREYNGQTFQDISVSEIVKLNH